MIEGAIISIIQRETQNRTLAINTGQNMFPTFFGQRLQASIYRYLKHLLSETIHPKVDHFSDNDAEGTKRQSDVNSNNQRLFVYPFIDKSEHPCKNTARNSQDNGRDNMYLYKLVFLVRVQPLIF